MTKNALIPLTGLAIVASFASGVGLPLASPAWADSGDGARQDIPITDPVLLERLGFEPAATNVYATAAAYEELLMDPTDRAAVQRARLADRIDDAETSPAGGPYGDLSEGYTSVSGYAIRPRYSETGHITTGFGERYCLGGYPFFDVLLEALPHGVRLTTGSFHWYDASPEDLEVSLWKITANPPDPPTATLLSDVASVGEFGYVHAPTPVLDHRVNLRDGTYLVRARLDGGDDSCSEGTNLRIVGAQLRWVRDVSLAPASASFDDVPTDHPFFRHIEALAASGITTGCGGGDFCPSKPLTRGQMAVFLAKALGLNWGVF